MPVKALTLNDQQRAAAEFDGGHALVLAGAGTGKTLTIVGRAAFLIATGVDPGRVLLLTFTRRAAREMTHRLRGAAGDAAAAMVAGTFHHFCLRTMRRLPQAFGLEQATVIDRDDQVSLMRLVRGGEVHKREGKQFPPAGQLISLLSYARNTNRPLREHLEKHTELDGETLERVGRIFAGYDKRKKRGGYLDYDDILHRFATVLRREQQVRERLCGQFDHVLVDEMQDTNPLQWLILDGLRDPAKLFCVGDDAQSIYAFRGADFRNVHAFAQRVEGATVLRLEHNYRSTQEILDLSNWLLADSSLPYGKRLVAHRGAGVRPRLIEFDSDFDEARWIGEDLVERHEAGGLWADHMVLTRTAFAARALEGVLVEKEIPYRFIGGTSLMQAAHVKDLLCLLRASLNHHDELAWTRYLTLWPGIGDVTAARKIAAMHGCPDLSAALALLRDTPRSGPDLVAPPATVGALTDQPPRAAAAAAEALEPLLSKRYERWDNRKRDLKLLVRLAERHSSLAAFLETYALEPVYATDRDRDEDEDAVTLITVHSAKGTEAPVCYLIRVEPGVYPHVRSVGDDDAEEEERRILYVALTRAQDELILTRTRNFRGRTVFHSGARAGGGRSPYLLQGLPSSLADLEEGDAEDDWDAFEAIDRW